MQTEIEAKFLEIDVESIRSKLKQLGASCVLPMRVMKRKNFDFPDHRLEKIGGWVRVRDEGDKVTLSYKQLTERTLYGTKEVSLTVDSFEETVSFLESIGLVQTSLQETKRESWMLGDAQIEIDEWPWTKPYIEIEAASEAEVKKAASKIGVDINRAVYGSVEIVYTNEYDVSEAEINATPIITFSVKPDWIGRKRK